MACVTQYFHPRKNSRFISEKNEIFWKVLYLKLLKDLNYFRYEDGEQEHCLEMWDRDGKGLGWNDTPCSFSTFFICEA